MRNSLLILLSLLVLLAAPTWAQDADDAPAPEPTAADKAFAELRDELNSLYSYIRQRGIGDEERRDLSELRDEVVAFNSEFADDERGVGLELQLSIWLEDRERVGALYERLLEILPDQSDKVLASWADYLLSLNDYRGALALIEAREVVWDQAPYAALAYATALMSFNRFDDAVEVLNAIEEVATEDAMLGARRRGVLQMATDSQPLWSTEQELRAAEAEADDLPRAEIVTSRGTIVVELFENEAPNTVANFVSLADKGFYDTSKFHRVVSNPPVIQGGDPNTKPDGTGAPGSGNPGYTIPPEHIKPDHRNHFAGTLAMARSNDPNSAGCQFYITHKPWPSLNGEYTVFGRVVDGFDVVCATKRDDEILSVKVLRKREGSTYEPATIPLPSTTPALPRPGEGSTDQ